jgi:hypothetical protein
MIAGHKSTLFPDGQGKPEAVGQRDSAPFGLELAGNSPEIRGSRFEDLKTVVGKDRFYGVRIFRVPAPVEIVV